MNNNDSAEYKPDHLVSKHDFDIKLRNLRRIYYQAIKSKPSWSGAEKITLEGEWTDNLKGLVDIGNATVTRSISYRLAESDDDANLKKELKK